MSRRIFCKLLLVVVAVFGLLVLSGVLLAQGRSADAFERVRQVQQAHTDRLMELKGVEGTAIGLDEAGRPAMLVLLENGSVGGVPNKLDGVPVKRLVTGKIYALIPPTNRRPKPPRGLTATAVSSTQINLDWRDNREAGVEYNVYRSTTSGAPYSEIASGETVSEYSDTGLAAGTTYYYVVTAENTAGESAHSEEASATTEGGTVEPPAAPTNLSATAMSSSQIDLSWTDNANNETVFKIERDSVQIDTVGANVSSYSDTGLDPLTTYTYRVRAYNSAGNSGYSNSASATTEAAPEKPPYWCERPVPIGVSTGHPDITAGTIGCRVTDGSNVYALSNNHVYADENNGIKGVDPVIQPGTYDEGSMPDDYIGTLADFEPIVFNPRANNTVDAAIALTNTDMVGNATPDGGYGTPSSTTKVAEPGLAVQKYGRTTGLTTGEVTGINATVKVRYDSGVARFVGQIVIGSGGFSSGGDSGSLIVTQEGKNPVGLLFAGSSTMTVANPIDDVLDAFGVTIDGE
jgi:hypothetical protein